MNFDLICLGGGSGGLSLATCAAKLGKNVAIIEGKELGGACLQRGCIPKKIMHYAATLNYQITKDSLQLGCKYHKDVFNWSILKATMSKYIYNTTQKLQSRLIKDNISFFRGYGSIVSPNKVQINSSNKDIYTIKGTKICLCMGSAPVLPTNIQGIEYCITSDQFFDLSEQPKSVIVLGSGYIGIELANLLHRLGTDTTIVMRSLPLPSFDDDLRQECLKNLKNIGIRVLFINDEFVIEKQKNSELSVNFKDGNTIQAEYVLAALGRKQIVSNFSEITFDISSEGNIMVSDDFETSVSDIYAIGDLIDTPHLTPVAVWQGRRLANLLYGLTEESRQKQLCPQYVPSAVFMYPPIASVGLSERKAIELLGKDHVIVYTKRFLPLFSSITESPYEFFIKLVCVEDKVVGLHLSGYQSDEIIQCLTVAISKGITRSELMNTVALHPTISEEIVT